MLQLFKMFKVRLVCLSLFSLVFPAFAYSAKVKDLCKRTEQPVIACGSAPSSVTDASGKLWVVFEYQQHLYVSSSPNMGKSYSPAIKVNKVAESIYTNGENRPKIVFGKNAEIYISWTKKTKGRFTGDIRFSRSLDGGQTFSSPITVNDDGLLTSHRFESIRVTQDGTIFLAWIDKRDNFELDKQGLLVAKKQKGLNGAIYTSFSTDSGKSFSKNQRLAASSCVCCRLAMTPVSNDAVAIGWRHVYPGNIRDHAFAIVNSAGIKQPAKRVSTDNWKINACPHHGPSMVMDQNKQLHMVWFTASESRKGIFYGRLNQSDSEADNLKNLSSAPSASHPYIASHENRLTVVWKIFDGKQSQIVQVQSKDLGKSWSDAKLIANAKGKSDHPFIISSEKNQWLTWWTQEKGFVVQPINAGERR